MTKKSVKKHEKRKYFWGFKKYFSADVDDS